MSANGRHRKPKSNKLRNVAASLAATLALLVGATATATQASAAVNRPSATVEHIDSGAITTTIETAAVTTNAVTVQTTAAHLYARAHRKQPPCWLKRGPGRKVHWCLRLDALHWAKTQKGCPYTWGGTGPCGQGYDCSGLVMDSYVKYHMGIPRTTYEMQDSSRLKEVRWPRPGDIVLYFGGSTAFHAALYLGHGQIWDALNQETPVGEQPLDYPGDAYAFYTYKW